MIELRGLHSKFQIGYPFNTSQLFRRVRFFLDIPWFFLLCTMHYAIIFSFLWFHHLFTYFWLLLPNSNRSMAGSFSKVYFSFTWAYHPGFTVTFVSQRVLFLNLAVESISLHRFNVDKVEKQVDFASYKCHRPNISILSLFIQICLTAERFGIEWFERKIEYV